MPEIIVVQPFNLRGVDGRLRSFRPSTMRLKVTDQEAQDPILRACSLRVEDRAPAPPVVKAPVKTKRNIARGSTNDQ